MKSTVTCRALIVWKWYRGQREKSRRNIVRDDERVKKERGEILIYVDEALHPKG